MSNENEEQRMECICCHRVIELGQELLTVEACVVGPRGIVPLEEPKVFCSADCLLDYLHDNDERTERVPRRVP